MSNDNHTQQSPMEDFFGEPISVYTTDEAIEDGVLFSPGQLNGRRIVVTTNLIAQFEKAALLTAIVRGIAETARFLEPDMAVFTIDDTKVYADWNGENITIMLPEDY